MPPPEPEVRWAGSAEPVLQEVAQTLGVAPQLVMAVREAHPSGQLVVLFSPGYPQDPELTVALLQREEGELHELRRARRPGLWDQLRAGLGVPDL
jgi:hypothetical protein